MNVKLYTRGSEYAGFRTLTTAADKPCAAPEKTAGNYDKVTIRRPAAGSDSGFARALAKTLNEKLEEGASQSEVMRLKSAVASGSYHPDARHIAERMLCYR